MSNPCGSPSQLQPRHFYISAFSVGEAHVVQSMLVLWIMIAVIPNVATLANITNMTVTMSTDSSKRVDGRMWDWIYGRPLEIRLWLKPEMS